ncbi:hypothetical protein [Brumimicrobium sp.]|uniref:hypothetical protein n=1 Tax=Brumimicrobium sp. TaxID=2029867 RepID=UPI003A926D44
MFKLIRVFLITSVFILFTTACKHYKVEGTKIESSKERTVVPYFNTAGKEYLYNAKIDVFNNELSGILVVKKLDDKRKRLALLSEFGNTLLDFEMINNEVNVIYIMEDLNKKLIVAKLKKYFQLLVHSNYEIKQTYSSENGSNIVSKLQGKRIILRNNNNAQLISLQQVSVWREKVKIDFYGEGKHADSIHFKSLELPVKIKLRMRK